MSGTFAVLALLFPYVNTRNIHHVDHVYPHSLLGAKKLKALELEESDIDQIGTLRDQLPNLELLEGPVNIGKSDTPSLAWATRTPKTGSRPTSIAMSFQAYPPMPSSLLTGSRTAARH